MTIIAETGFSTGNSIEVPMQLILKRENDEYVSRFKTKEGMEFTGHYCKDSLDIAEQQFVRRVREHNETYLEDNASHLGPIKWMCANEL